MFSAVSLKGKSRHLWHKTCQRLFLMFLNASKAMFFLKGQFIKKHTLQVTIFDIYRINSILYLYRINNNKVFFLQHLKYNWCQCSLVLGTCNFGNVRLKYIFIVIRSNKLIVNLTDLSTPSNILCIIAFMSFVCNYLLRFFSNSHLKH